MNWPAAAGSKGDEDSWESSLSFSPNLEFYRSCLLWLFASSMKL